MKPTKSIITSIFRPWVTSRRNTHTKAEAVALALGILKGTDPVDRALIRSGDMAWEVNRRTMRIFEYRNGEEKDHFQFESCTPD